MQSEYSGNKPSNLGPQQKEQHTQTSGALTNSNKSHEKITDFNNKRFIKVIESCQVIQDPECPKSVTIIKESITEETIKHPSESTGQNNTANRYKYCKEVIKPYLKYVTHGSVSNEILLKKALDSASDDFPDLQTSLAYFVDQKQTSDITEASAITSDSKNKVHTTFFNMDKKNSKECVPCDPDDSTCSPSEACETPAPSSPKQKPPCGPPAHTRPKCEKKIVCKPKVKKVCPKESESKCDGVTDIILVHGPDENPETNETEESIDEEKVSSNDFESEKKQKCSVTENCHDERLATIKAAAKDLVGKAYKTHLTLLNTANNQEKFNVFDVANDNEKANEDKRSETLLKYYFFRKTDDLDSEETDVPQSTTKKVIGKILTTVDSAFKAVSKNISKSVDSIHNSSYNNMSSPFDKPKATKETSQNVTPDSIPASNSVFSALKNKIFSMFTEASPKPEKPPMNLSTSSSSFNEDDIDDEY